MTTKQVADRLVELCRVGQMQKAQEELYGQSITSVEPKGAPVERAEGFHAVSEKGKAFASMIEERHGLSITDPIVNGKQFSIGMTLDATMKGQGRRLLEEICVYRVEDGKIVYEEFVY
ncbi:MAG: nuclear transport factor 2 family protein [Bacteroidetes bacterium]|nr:nuclear transport factor 2 family protein [Bacteroidota bacterium]